MEFGNHNPIVFTFTIRDCRTIELSVYYESDRFNDETRQYIYKHCLYIIMIIHFVTVYLQTWRCETTYKDRTGILPSPPGRTDLS